MLIKKKYLNISPNWNKVKETLETAWHILGTQSKQLQWQVNEKFC